MYIKKTELLRSISGAEKQLRKIQRDLDRIGASRLICRKQRGRMIFTEYKNKKEHGITRDKARIALLARKEYLKEYAGILRVNINALQKFHDSYIEATPEEIAEKVHRKHPNLPSEIMLYPVDNSWASASYEKNPFYKEDLQYYTTNGVIVRSKSERDIANALEEAGIPYRYDVKIKCGDTIYYADFVIKRPDGSLLIWEHFGRENDKAYMAKNRVRIQDYIAMGYRPWDNLIWTLESDMKDLQNIQRIIKRFILTTV